MAESKDQLDPKEDTEAKLCAYLEGEMLPDQRAEIEQHLASNPQHRHLLGDLARTREWMRSIPQETSPVDLAEIFEGQVERSMLLDYSDERSFTRWPQFFMAAAIVGLALGLGAMLFAILKRPGQAKSFSISGPVPVVSPLPSTLPSEQPVTTARTVNLNEAPAPSAMTPEALPAPQGGEQTKALDATADAMKEMHVQAMRAVAPDPDSPDAIKARLLRAGYPVLPNQKAVALVVSADSTSATADHLRGFFIRHQLAFDDAITGKHESPVPQIAGLPSTQPIAMNAPNGQSELGQAANQIEANHSQSQVIPHAALSQQIPTTAPTDEPIYVARGMTPLQLELLSTSLAMDGGNPSVRRVALSEGIEATTQEIIPPGAVTRGQMLSITVAQLVGPGMDKTNVVKVSEDGTVALPMIDPVPAAGALPVEIAQRIAGKYREANLIPQATVTVAMTTPASTQPAAIATTQATTQASIAATQPAVQIAGVDVVVLIEKAAMPAK